MDQNLKTYTFDEALKASTEYFHGDTLAATVFLNKYALKDSDGILHEKTPEDMHHRLAAEFARIEKKYKNPISEDELFNYMKNFKYIVPAGSPMSGIGNYFQKYASLANCYVVPSPYDSFSGIMSTSNDICMLFRHRGGAGFDISTLRPENAPVNNTARTSSGMASFMELFSTVTKSVCQQSRRGALMLTSHIKHIDSQKFINAKTNLNKVTSANISVRIDDDFMKAVESDSDYTLQWPVDSKTPQYTKIIKAKDLWKNIVHNAWAYAEPGVLFWDTLIKESVSDCYAKKYENLCTISTNPCSELPLSGWSSCRLNTINLYGFVKNPYTSDAYFDFDELKKAVRIAQRMLDDLVDLDLEKIEDIINKISNPAPDEPERLVEQELYVWENVKKQSLMERRTGLGITALGDALAALGLKYGSKEATEKATEIQQTIALEAYKTSIELGKERGVFSVFEYELEKDNPFLNRLYAIDPNLREDMKKYGRRNIACLTIAPTGSVSLMTQTSSGIEPVFMTMYKRRRKVNQNDKDVHIDFIDENTGEAFEEYIVFHPKFKEWMEINGYDTEKKYSQKELDEMISKSPYKDATANDIDWLKKVEMLGKIQKYVDHSISVTVNLPESASEELVSDLYMTAWKVGAKGLTIFRENSRPAILSSVSSDKKKDKKPENKVIEDRPVSLAADVLRFKNNKENWIAFVGKLPDGSPYEIFTGLVDDENGIFELPKTITSGHIVKRIKDDGTKSYDFEFENKRGTKVIVEGLNAKFNPEFWNYSKLLSSVLRYKMPMNHVLHLVESLDIKEDSINSWKSGVTRALKKFVKDGDDVVGGEKCPDCGGKLTYQDGCVICLNCGYSRCG